MSQQLGRIERVPAEQYRGKRKVLLVPVFNIPQPYDQDATDVTLRYWEQVTTQVAALEATLGGLHRIYHENLTEGGESGLKQLEMMNQSSLALVQEKCDTGSTLEATESIELLAEVIDLQRCLILPLASDKVAARLGEWFGEANRSRYEHIGSRINDTLGDEQTGLLFVGERHQVQFAQDIEVFYVAPPALDEFRRWLQGWLERQQTPPPTESGQEAREEAEG